MVFRLNKNYNNLKPSFPPIVFLSIFKGSGKKGKRKGAKGKATEQDIRRAQASELKLIIQEMVDELQDVDSQKAKPGMPSDKPISGRSKDIVDYESVLQSRRKEIMKKIHKERKGKKKKRKRVTSTHKSLSNLDTIVKDDTSKSSEVYIPAKKYYEEPDLTDKEIDIPSQPKLKPTEEGVVEFDPDKYFHEREAPVLISEPKIMKYDEIDDSSKSKRGRPKKYKGKKKRKIEAPGKPDEELGLGVEYLEELSVLDELLSVLESAKKSDSQVNLQTMISDMERIITDYQSTEEKIENTQKKYAEYFDVIEELEELEELEEVDDIETLEELEELDELEELEELEEASDSKPKQKKSIAKTKKKSPKKKKKDKSKSKQKLSKKPKDKKGSTKKPTKKKKKKAKKSDALDELPELEVVE